MSEFQVWHKHGNRYDKVAEVDIGNVEGAAILTAISPESWHGHPQISPMPGNHRATGFGDIIIDAEGVEYRFEAEVGRGGFPGFIEVSVIFDQEMIEIGAIRALEDATAIGFDPTGVDGYLATERVLFEEWRADEHAARVRDFGAADAATYDERMAEADRLLAVEAGPAKPTDTVGMEALLDEIEASWPARTPDAAGDHDLADYDRLLTLAAARRPANDNQRSMER